MPLDVLMISVAAAAVALLSFWLGSRFGRRSDLDASGMERLRREVEELRRRNVESEKSLAVEQERSSRAAALQETVDRLGAELESARAASSEAARLQTGAEQDRIAAEARAADLETRLSSMTTERSAAQEALAAAERRAVDAEARAKAKDEASDQLAATLRTARADLASLQAEKERLSAELSAAREALAQQQQANEEKLRLLSDAKESLTKEFRVLADDVLRVHGQTFSEANKKQVEGLLTPLKDKILEFQQGLQLAHTESTKERATLAQQIRGLTDLSARMTSETTNLTRALKGQAHTQGAWGEMILETILQQSGLEEGREYFQQESHTDEDGGRLRPDVTVVLPNGQKIVVDAKVSLRAYHDWVNAEDEEVRADALRRHVLSMRSHVRGLSAKAYDRIHDGPDFVLMFVPIEPALGACVQADAELTAYAMQNRVSVTTPTTLMMALRMVHCMWQVERRNANAELIADRAGKLYDKFVGFAENLKGVGDRLEQAQRAYSGAMGQLQTGKGNLLWQTEKLRELGARATKRLPVGFVSEAEEEDGPELLAPPSAESQPPESR